MDQSCFCIPALTGYSLYLGIERVLQRTKWGNGKIGKDITGWEGEVKIYLIKVITETAIRTWRKFV